MAAKIDSNHFVVLNQVCIQGCFQPGRVCLRESVHKNNRLAASGHYVMSPHIGSISRRGRFAVCVSAAMQLRDDNNRKNVGDPLQFRYRFEFSG